MAANNDFFLKFDSNATQWAQGLAGQLKPARDAVVSLQRALYGLENKAGSSSAKVRAALGEQAGRRGGGGGADPSAKVESKVLKEAIHEQADAVKGLTEQLTVTIAGLRVASAEMTAMPGKLQSTIKSIKSSLARAVEIAEGRGRDVDSTGRLTKAGTGLRQGSDELAVLNIVKQAVQRGLGASAVGGIGRSSVPAGGIASIRRSDIDRANFDRVVLAIRSQTRVLSQGIKVTGAPTNTVVAGSTKPPKPGKPAKAAPEEDLETRVSKIKSDITEVQGDIAEIIKLLGDDLDEASQDMVNKLKKTESKLKAQLAKVERDETGISRGDQSKVRRKAAEAAREARETITDVERERRDRVSRLLASPGAPDFDTRLGRARTEKSENYSLPQLKQMAAAYREVGIEIRENTKTTKAELADRLKAGHAQLQGLYPEGVPGLNTRGVNVQRTSKIPESAQSILGDLNALVAERLAARKVLSVDALGGGTGPLPKGRQGFGAGILGLEVGTPIARGGTPADVRRAAEVFGSRAAEQMGRVRELVQDQSFDPYDRAHRVTVGGEKGSEEREKGLAAAARLRDIREATQTLDGVAKSYYDLSEGISENKSFIDRAAFREERGRSKETDPEKVAAARQQIAASQQAMAQIRQEFGKLFDDPRFQTGYHKREGEAYGYGVDRQGNPIGSRALLQGQAGARQQRAFTESDYQALLRSTGSAVAGVRTRIGSKDVTRNIPGLGFKESTGRYFSTDNQIGVEDQKKLNQATRKLATAQTRYFQKVNDSTATQEEIDKAFHGLETAANKFANQIAKNFGGLAPSIETLLGDYKEGTGAGLIVPELSEKTRSDELRRQEARDAAEKQRNRKFQDEHTPEEAARRSADVISNVENRLAKVTAERAKVLEKLNSAEEKLGRVSEAEKKEGKQDLTATEREHALGQQAQLATQYRQVNAAAARAAGLRDLFQDVNEHGRDPVAIRTGEGRVKQQAGGVAGGLGIEGHLLGPDVTLDRAINELTQRMTQLTRQQQELVRRGQGGGLVADDNNALIKRVEDVLRTAKGLRDQTGLGGSSLQQVYQTLDQQAKAKYQETASFGRTSGLGSSLNEFNKLVAQAGALDGELDELNAELDEARAAAQKSTEAISKETTAKKASVAATVAETNGRLAELKVKQAAIRAEGDYTKKAAQAAYKRGGAEDPEYQAIRDRRDRLRQVKKDIEKLDGAGSGKGGGGARTASGAADGDGGRRSLLGQILAELQKIHTTLKGGVKVTGATAQRADDIEATAKTRTPSSRSVTATKAELDAAKSANAAERDAAMEVQRRRQNRLRQSDVDKAHVQALEMEARMQNELAGAYNKSEAELREQARAKQNLEQTTRLLTRDTEQEINKLRTLTQEAQRATTAEQKLAAAEKVAAQQVRVAGAVNRDLRDANLYAGDRRQGVSTVLGDAGPELGKGEVDSILKNARNHPEFRKTGQGWGEEMADGSLTGFAHIFGGSKGFFQRVLNTTGTFVVRNFAAGFVFGLTNALQEVIDQAIQTEATFVRVSSAMEATGKDIGSLRGDLAGISTDYGVALNDVYNTAAGLSGLFSNAEDLAGATRIAAQMQIISGGAVNATEAIGILASTMSAFEALPGDDPLAKVLPDGVAGLQHVMDSLTAIQNNLGVNIETTAEGVSAVAGLARQMSLSFEETAVFTAQIAKQTNQTGAAAGEQFSRILGAAQTGRGRKALTDAFGAEATGALATGDYGQLFKVLISGYGDLTDAQKRNLSTSLAGQRQQRAFNALVNNGASTLNLLARAEDANGDAQDRMEKIMKTLNNRLAKFSQEVTNLAQNLVRSGILNFLGILLVGTTQVLDVINKILVTLNGVADENQFIGMLRKMITLLLGAGIAFKLLGTGVRGVRGALASLPQGTNPTGPPAPRNAIPFGGIGRSQATVDAQGRQRQAYISRAASFGIDRTVGVAASATGRGLVSLGKRIESSDRTFGRFQTRMESLSRLLQRGEAGASRLRGGIAGFGSGGQVGGYFERRALAHDERASALRDRASSVRSNVSGLAAPGQARFLAYADDLDKTAAKADRAAATHRKLGNTLGRLNETGALTDAAMLGLAVGIAAVGSSLSRHKRISEDLQAGYDAAYGKNAGKNAAEQADEYLGRIADDAGKEFEEESKKNVFSAGLDAVGARFTNGWKGFFDGQTANMREFGLDEGADGGFETYGLSDANDRLKNGLEKLHWVADNVGTTGADIRKASQNISDDITEKAIKINADSNLSDAQKQQALGALQSVQKLIGDEAEQLAAIQDGMGAAIALSTDQVKKLQEATQVAASTGGLTSFGGGAGAVDLSGIYDSLIADVGAQEGSRIDTILKKMFSGNSDAADIAVGTSRLLQDEVKQLQNSLESKIAQNVDPEEIESVRSQLISTVSQLVQQQEAVISAILTSGQQLSDLYSNTGRDAQSAQAFGQAMNRAERYYQNQTKEQRNNIRNARRASRAALNAARAVPNNPLLGGILTPRQVANQEGAQSLKGKDTAHALQMADQVSTAVEKEISRQTRPLRIKQSKEKDPKVRAFYDQKIAELTLGILNQVNAGLAPPGLENQADIIDQYGNAAVTQEQLAQEQINANQAAIAYSQSALDTANTAAQNAFDLRSAQLGVASAYADARGDAVLSAQIQVKVARAALALAQTQLAEAVASGATAQQITQARVAVLGAQAGLIAANAAVSQAQQDLVQSRYEVSIALAEAAGNSVLAAKRTLEAARAALRAALKQSGGEATAEVNAARAQAIQAEAALRDTKLQDDLDTIDFNLQMNRITSAGAIAALQEILRTRDLTRDQRRQLLLQIKGMKDELADSQWNFGNIKLPTPYQMKAYITARRDQFRKELDTAALGRGSATAALAGVGGGGGSVSTQTNYFQIDGADINEVRKVIREVVGGGAGTITRTTGARRR